jgi:hypothetical protein
MGVEGAEARRGGGAGGSVPTAAARADVGVTAAVTAPLRGVPRAAVDAPLLPPLGCIRCDAFVSSGQEHIASDGPTTK